MATGKFSDSFSASLEQLGREASSAATPVYKLGNPAVESLRGVMEASAKVAPPPPAPTREQAREQLEHLEETKVLLAALNQTIQNAEVDRKQAEQDRHQQSLFNKRMTVVAIALSFAAVVAPFLIYFLEHGWWWEAYRP